MPTDSSFQFQTAGRIHFGPGAAARLPEILSDRRLQAKATPGAADPTAGSRVLFVCGRNPERTAPLRRSLAGQGFECDIVSIGGEPSIEDAQRGVARAREFGAGMVLAVGGGSVLDAGKAIAALSANPGEPLDYLEVVGAGRPLQNPGLPVIAVPTTAGTGSEVTRNAVLAAKNERVKVSMRGEELLPFAAVVDPELSLSCPPAVTADCGLDALTQVIEPLVSNKANPLTDGLAREGVRRSARSLRRSCEEPGDLAARTDLCFTSLAGGLALANSGLGAVHGFAGPLGGMFPIPHGAVCARLLPIVIEANVTALRADESGARLSVAERSEYLRRYREVAVLLTGRADASIEAGVEWLRRLCTDLGIKGLREFGVGRPDMAAIVSKSKRSSSMRGNCLELNDAELTEILERAL